MTAWRLYGLLLSYNPKFLTSSNFFYFNQRDRCNDNSWHREPCVNRCSLWRKFRCWMTETLSCAHSGIVCEETLGQGQITAAWQRRSHRTLSALLVIIRNRCLERGRDCNIIKGQKRSDGICLKALTVHVLRFWINILANKQLKITLFLSPQRDTG